MERTARSRTAGVKINCSPAVAPAFGQRLKKCGTQTTTISSISRSGLRPSSMRDVVTTTIICAAAVTPIGTAAKIEMVTEIIGRTSVIDRTIDIALAADSVTAVIQVAREILVKISIDTAVGKIAVDIAAEIIAAEIDRAITGNIQIIAAVNLIGISISRLAHESPTMNIKMP